MDEHTYRNDDFSLKENVEAFVDEAESAVDNLYIKGEDLGLNYRDVCYLLGYLVYKNHRMELYREEVASI